MSTAGAGRGVWPDVERSQDHLWSLGEYVCHLPLYWSDVLWPTNLPTFSQVQPGDVDPAARLDQPAWDELVGRIEVFKTGLPNVRKVLATVPSLMLLDDHEVTDDWNLNYLWTASVYGNARGQRLVCNGLLAYTLFQHWGNVPTRFATAGTPEAQIL